MPGRLARLAGAAALITAAVACAGPPTATPGAQEKPARACQAVDDATRLAMSPADRLACEATMRGWYAETWYPRPDPADKYDGPEQLRYLRAKAVKCLRTADDYGVTGPERWTVVMRCLVIVRKH